MKYLVGFIVGGGLVGWVLLRSGIVYSSLSTELTKIVGCLQ